MRKLKEKTGNWEYITPQGLICRIFGHKWGYARSKIEQRLVGITPVESSVKIRNCKRCRAKQRMHVNFIY